MESPKFTVEAWKKVLTDAIEKINYLSATKGGEYAAEDDRLDNFRRNGERLGLPMEVVWGVYASKHWDALQTYIRDINRGRTRARSEPIEGRADDLIVYLLLFKAMLAERKEMEMARQLANSAQGYQQQNNQANPFPFNKG